MEENNVHTLERKKVPGIKFRTTAKHVEESGQFFFYETETWLRKDEIIEVLKSHPNYARANCYIYTRLKGLECKDSFESIMKQLEA